MMQLLSLLLSLSAEQILNFLSVALCLALAAGMNDRLGALIAACLTLALLLV